MGKVIYRCEPDMAKARNRVDNANYVKDEVKVSSLLSSFATGKKYFIKTFGCQANVRDEEIMSGYLELAGYLKGNEDDADIVIINTCAVRENAEEKVYGEIGKWKVKTKASDGFILAVCGCMMQQEGMGRKIMTTYPYVSLVFGTHNIHKLISFLEEIVLKKKHLVDVMSFPGDVIENLPSRRLDKNKAFVNIAYGCDKFCTYCIVPYTRGRERSRKKEDIIAECKQLVEEGYKEITLLGQNVNSYGKDFKDGTSFADILEEVAKLGIPRLRFMTSHPWDFSLKMLDVIAKYDNIMKCIHLPVQSGSTEMLRRMGRRYSREDYLELVKNIREKIPGCAITTDIIVGFPNETEEEFEDTLSLVETVKYDAAFTFIYSPRRGTPAARIEDNVTDEVKHERFNKLLKVVEHGVLTHSSEMVGKTYKVLVDGASKKDDSMLSGYTESSKLVNFKGPSYLKGQIVNVKVVEDHAYHLLGELLDDPIIVLAKALKKELDKEEVVKHYLECKQAYENDTFLKTLRFEIEQAQRDMSLSLKANKQEEYLLKKKEYQTKMKQYEDSPIVKNYEASVAEMNDFVKEVEDILK